MHDGTLVGSGILVVRYEYELLRTQLSTHQRYPFVHNGPGEKGIEAFHARFCYTHLMLLRNRNFAMPIAG